MKKVLYILAELDDDDVQWMSENGSRNAYSRGEVLITQGEDLDSLFVALDGRFSVAVDGVEVARIGAGEVLGEISFVDDHSATATVTAVEASHVLAIPHGVVRAKLKVDPEFAARFYLALATFLADRLRSTLQLVRSGTGESHGSYEDEERELDFDRLDALSRAGDRFHRVLRQLGTN
jgi:CRP/FNR family transcriptional regulator, cyclic AMP receptor protein